MSAPMQAGNALQSAVADAIRRSADYLAGVQAPDGHWCAELTADTTLESDFILFQLWLHPPVDGVWTPASRPRIDKAVRSILARQLDDGGFNTTSP
jgi:squalene-hopene/tetraprenyl-beta-curcumene cyclase